MSASKVPGKPALILSDGEVSSKRWPQQLVVTQFHR
jgi:hypothetical protein